MCTPSMSYRRTTSRIVASTYARAAGFPGSIHVCAPYFRTQSGCARVTCDAAIRALEPGSRARNGLNQACSCKPRACASVTANASGSYAGLGPTPDVPLSAADHGAYVVGYMASPAMRTCSSTALRPDAAARSSIARNSARCESGDSPGADGQSRSPRSSMDVAHAPRNSRATGGGGASGARVVRGDVGLLLVPASSVRSVSARRIITPERYRRNTADDPTVAPRSTGLLLLASARRVAVRLRRFLGLVAVLDDTPVLEEDPLQRLAPLRRAAQQEL